MPLLVVTFLGNRTLFSIRFELSCEFSWSWLSLLVVFRLFPVHRGLSSLVSLFFWVFLKQLHFDSFFFRVFNFGQFGKVCKYREPRFFIFFTIFWSFRWFFLPFFLEKQSISVFFLGFWHHFFRW